MYYANNLLVVIQFVKNFSGVGLLGDRANEEIADPTLASDLMATDYETLIQLVSNDESRHFSIAETSEQQSHLNFHEDVCRLQNF